LIAYIAAFFAVEEKSVGTRIVFILLYCKVKLTGIIQINNDFGHNIKVTKRDAMKNLCLLWKLFPEKFLKNIF